MISWLGPLQRPAAALRCSSSCSFSSMPCHAARYSSDGPSWHDRHRKFPARYINALGDLKLICKPSLTHGAVPGRGLPELWNHTTGYSAQALALIKFDVSTELSSKYLTVLEERSGVQRNAMHLPGIHDDKIRTHAGLAIAKYSQLQFLGGSFMSIFSMRSTLAMFLFLIFPRVHGDVTVQQTECPKPCLLLQ